MTNRLEIYKCEICGNIVEVMTAGTGTLVCCGEDMKLMEEKTADVTTEKHVPVISKVDGGFKVVVGSTLHPMIKEHYIEWIQLIVDGKSYRQFLNPGDAPEATFMAKGDKIIAREYCNIHLLWKNEL